MDRYTPTAEPVSATRVPPGPTHDFGPFMADISAKGATAWSVKPTGVLIKFGDNRGRTYAWGSWLIFDEGDLGHMPRADLDDDAFRSAYRLDDGGEPGGLIEPEMVAPEMVADGTWPAGPDSRPPGADDGGAQANIDAATATIGIAEGAKAKRGARAAS